MNGDALALIGAALVALALAVLIIGIGLIGHIHGDW